MNKHLFLICLGTLSLVPRSARFWDHFWDLQGPKLTKKGSKLPKNGQNPTLRALEVRNGWNGVERSWNEVRDIYVGIFRPIGSSGVTPILAQGRPKRAQIAQKRPKSYFEGSRGPKRLERRGTKLERGTGHICWDFQTNWECGGDPNFGPGAPKKGPNGPKMAKI